MSSRVLRKLQGDKDLNDEVSDNETDISSSVRKQLNVNRYDLVNFIHYFNYIFSLCIFFS